MPDSNAWVGVVGAAVGAVSGVASSLIAPFVQHKLAIAKEKREASRAAETEHKENEKRWNQTAQDLNFLKARVGMAITRKEWQAVIQDLEAFFANNRLALLVPENLHFFLSYCGRSQIVTIEPPTVQTDKMHERDFETFKKGVLSDLAPIRIPPFTELKELEERDRLSRSRTPTSPNP